MTHYCFSWISSSAEFRIAFHWVGIQTLLEVHLWFSVLSSSTHTLLIKLPSHERFYDCTTGSVIIFATLLHVNQSIPVYVDVYLYSALIQAHTRCSASTARSVALSKTSSCVHAPVMTGFVHFIDLSWSSGQRRMTDDGLIRSLSSGDGWPTQR